MLLSETRAWGLGLAGHRRSENPDLALTWLASHEGPPSCTLDE